MEKNNNIGEVYKTSFENFEMTPSPETWGKIENSLKEKTFFQRYKLPLISLGAALLIFSGYLIFRPEQSLQAFENPEMALNNASTSQPTSVGFTSNTDTISNVENDIIQEHSSKKNRLESTQNTKQEKVVLNSNSIPSNESKNETENTLLANQNTILEEQVDSLISPMADNDVSPSKANTTVQNTDISSNSETASPKEEDNIIQNDEPSTVSTIEETKEDITMPNALSLSNINHKGFKPSYVCKTCHSFEMIIYSKAGEIISRTHDITTGWDGTFRGQPVKNDTYIYVISYKKENTNQVKQGFVMVLN